MQSQPNVGVAIGKQERAFHFVSSVEPYTCGAISLGSNNDNIGSRVNPRTMATLARPFSNTMKSQFGALKWTESTLMSTSMAPIKSHIVNTTQSHQLFSTNNASSRKRARRSKTRLKDNGPPMNDELARMICRNLKTDDLSSIQVRLVMELERNAPPEVSVVSLSEAFVKARESRLDLIGVSIDQKPPVIKAADYNRIFFDMQKKSRDVASSTDKKAKKVLPLKEFRFKAGIADNDFERKASSMLEFLNKGHLCQVSIFCKYRLLKQDSELISKMAKRICDLAEEHVSQIPKVSLNGTQRAVIKLNPKKQI